jgi:hypothetical protein
MFEFMHEDLDKLMLSVLFAVLVALAAYFHNADKVFDLCNDMASACFGALLTIITRPRRGTHP